MVKNTQTLDPKPNVNVVSGLTEPAIKDALKLISDNNLAKQSVDSKNRLVQKMLEDGFTIQDATGAKKINGKKLMQALWKTVNRTKPLDFELHASQRPEHMQSLSTRGLATVLEKGNYGASFRDKGGMAINTILYGDGFRLINQRSSKGFPIEFVPVDNMNLFVDTKATSFRRGNRPVQKALVIFSGSWGEFISYSPDAKKIAGTGRIPREMFNKELGQTWPQKIKDAEDMVEWAYYFDIQNKNMTLFAGSACTILEEYSGEDYPYVMKDEEENETPYIPISHYFCYPSTEGFYNHGIGEMIYDLVSLYSKLFNMMSGHVEDNVYPDVLLNLPAGEAGKFFEKMAMARRMRANGEKAFIAMEYNPQNPNSQASAQSLVTQSLFNESQVLFDRIDLEIKRLGIHLDEPESADATATQTLADEENANSFVKQMMEYNASEVKFEIEIAIDMIKKFITKGNKIPIQLSTKVIVDGGELKIDALTLGMLKDEFTKNSYYVTVNARSGAIPSNVMRRAELTQTIQMLAPGSPEFSKVAKQLAELNNVDLNIPAPQSPAQGTQEQVPPPAEPGSETDRMTFNPRVNTQQVAI